MITAVNLGLMFMIIAVPAGLLDLRIQRRNILTDPSWAGVSDLESKLHAGSTTLLCMIYSFGCFTHFGFGIV